MSSKVGSAFRSVFRWLKQLYLLLWKNTLLRLREGSLKFGRTRSRWAILPVFLGLETLWPIALYLVLLILRLKFPPEDHSDAIYRANALPSAGAMPFLQTVMCDLNGGRDEYKTDMPVYPNATLNQFYSLLDEVGSWKGDSDRLCDSVHALAGQADCVSGGLNATRANQGRPECQEDVAPLNCFLKNATEFDRFLRSNLTLPNRTVDAIMTSTVDRSQIPFTGGLPIPGLPFPTPSSIGNLGGFGPLIQSDQLRTLLGCDSDDQSQLDRFIHFGNNVTSVEVARDVCNLTDTQFNSLADELQDQIQLNQQIQNCDPVGEIQRVSDLLEIQQALRLWLGSGTNFSSVDGFTGDSKNNDSFWFFCGEAGKKKNKILEQFLGRVKFGDSYQQAQYENQGGSLDDSPDMIALKILYTPVTDLTRSILKKANRTFETAVFFMEWSGQVANCSQFFLDNFPPDSPQIVQARQIIDLLLQANEGAVGTIPVSQLNSLGQNITITNQSLLDAKTLLNESAPGNIWEVMTVVHDESAAIHDTLATFDWNVFMPLPTEEAMEALAADYEEQERKGITHIAAGVVFDENLPPKMTPDLTNATFKIRMNSTFVHDTTAFRESVWIPGPENDNWKRIYIEGWFVFIQDMIERALAEQLSNKRIASPGLYIHQMPYPCWKEDPYVAAMQWVFPLAMIFAWLFPVAMTVRGIVREKEVRLKEFMKMMGVSDSTLRLSWFISSGVIFFISVTFITIILKAGGILPYTHWALILIYLSIYAVTMIAFSFFMSVFFNNANLAACVASLLYFLVFFVQVTLIPNQQSLHPFVLGLVCLWAPVAFGLGSTYIVQWELQQVGLQWGNMAVRSIPEDNLTFSTITAILVFDIFLYMGLTWYIEGVYPGRYGVSKPWYFPFMPSYWCGQRGRGLGLSRWFKRGGARHVTLVEDGEDTEMKAMANGSGEEDSDGVQLGNGVEVQEPVCEEDPALPQGISIKGLSKTFSSGPLWKRKKVEAVKKLSLNFYEGQITAFLGHNGAGKTSTMSVLTGLFEPTEGTAHIYGSNIRRHMDIIRQNLGMCPQHNILFDSLTVEEHLLFYGQMKGLSRQVVMQQIPEWLDKVDLLPHRNKLSKHLSGGMKRKLSILLAFIGDSRTIILDEPTSGVDPYARRQIWHFLLRHREGRTIMLSTHHMDEAELLGDRIAIISQGSLLCCGSFEYLKTKFGRGHELTLVTSTQSDRRHSTSSRTFVVQADVEETDQVATRENHSPLPPIGMEDAVDRITNFIKGHVTSSTLEERRGRELRFLLPLTQARPTVLARLFQQLELQKTALGVVSYGLTACSMEEIFVRLTEKDVLQKEEEPSDAAVPKPSLRSTGSLASLNTPANQNADGAPSAVEPCEEEDDLREDESAFDEEGLLFGDTSCDDPLGTGRESARQRLTGVKLWLSQFLALTVKRFHYTKRRYIVLSIQNIFPFLVLALSLLIAHTLQSVPDPPPLELSPELFLTKSPENYIFVGGPETNETTPIMSTLFKPCGAGGHLLGSSMDPNSPCYYSNEPATCPVLTYPQEQYICTCSDMCNDTVPFPFLDDPPPCYKDNSTGSSVQNLTSMYAFDDPETTHEELREYLLRSKNSFIERRYGGLSFGHEKIEVDPEVDEINTNNDSTLPLLATHSAAKVWYSLKGYHAMPTYINVMNNAILRANLDEDKDPAKYGIRTVNHPFKMTELSKALYAVRERVSFLVNPLAAIFSLGFVLAGFVIMLIEERSGKVKHLQLVCGMNKFIYWVSTFVWDLLWYLTFVILVVVLYAAFRDPYFTTPEVFPVFLLLLVCYGLATIPWMYVLSFAFSSPATAYVVLFCLNFFVGFCLLIVDAILVYLSDLDNADEILQYYLIYVPVPSYSLVRTMMYFSLDHPILLAVSSFTFEPVPDISTKLAPFVGSLIIQAVLYTLIIVTIELAPYVIKLASKNWTVFLRDPHDEDREVARERRRVARGDGKNGILTLDNITKVYGYNSLCSRGVPDKIAVNQLCLIMKKAECFGLLGVNGAGKTTTFRMLTGDTVATGGDALIGPYSVSESLGPIQQSFGYCPQVDALIDPLTGRQHLTLYCKLRGLPSDEVKRVVDWALLKLGLEQYADKPAGTYSGGNRRKLSTAISLLARPQLILLDEPTSGVDPRSKRFLWSIIRGLVQAGQSVLLTTHSMAECEALCSRVGIMVNGEFRCLGSPQQLKSLYGEGYSLKIRVIGEIEAVKEFVRQNFDGSVLKEEHLNTLVYQLPMTDMQLHNVFETMEQGRQSLDIQDYTVSQTTLDDVFIHFASQQSEDILDHTHRPHPPAADLESGVANSDVDRLPDIVPPGNGSRKLTSSTGGIIKYTKLQDSVEVDTDHDHEQ